MRNTLKVATLESRFPFFTVETGCIISKGAGITAILEVDLPELFTVAAAKYEAIHAVWAKVTKVLPNYTVIHKQDWFIREDYRSQTDKENLNFLPRSYEIHFDKRPFLNHKYYLYLTKTTKECMRMQSSFSSLCRGFVIPKEVDEDTTAHFLSMVGQFARIVDGTGLVHLGRLVGDEITNTENRAGLVEKYFCLSMENATALEDIELGDDDLRVSDRRVPVYTLSRLDALPSKVGMDCRYGRLLTDESDYKLSFASPVGLLFSYNHLYNQCIFLDDDGENLQRLGKNACDTQSLSEYSRNSQISKEWIDLYLNDARSFGLASVRAHCDIIVWTDNPMGMKNIHNDVGSQIAMMECKPCHNTVDAATPCWATIPGNGTGFPAEESFYTFIEQAPCFWVEKTGYCNSVSPFGLKIPGRISGKPLHVDILGLPMRHGVTTNRNKFVLGSSGSGKSLFTNRLVRQYYEQDTHVVLIDAGNSYQGLYSPIHQKSGRRDDIYFTYTDENPIAFNPFFTDDKVFDIERRESIKTLILILWKENSEPATRSEEMALSNAVSLYTRRVKEGEDIVPPFNTFYEFVKTDYRRVLEEKGVRKKDFNLARFLNMLEPYYHDGEYDFLFNSDKQLDLLGKRFIAFEIDQIENHPILFPVATIIIMELFISKMRHLRRIHRIIIIEEAWRAIARERMADCIRYLFKAVRKFYGEAVVVTQEVDDIISPPVVKESIVDNSDCKILLDQRKYLNKFPQIQSLLGLTDREKAQILSVNMSSDPRHKYKEVWFGLGGVQSAVYAAEISLEECLCHSTEEGKRVGLEGLTEELGGNIELAIQRLVEEKRNQSNEIP